MPGFMFANISNKTRSELVGAFILIAYCVLASGLTQSKLIVMTADVISGFAVIGIAVLMYPVFIGADKNIALIYLILKILEGLLMIFAGIFFIGSEGPYYRDAIYNGIHLYVFIVSGFIFYYLLFVSNSVPGFICVWGVLGITALLISTLLKLAGTEIPVLNYFLVLIISNEIFLAIWLMVKGFRMDKDTGVQVNLKV